MRRIEVSTTSSMDLPGICMMLFPMLLSLALQVLQSNKPIETREQSLGKYISIYDIQRAVDDGATVPIYYESRLAKLALNEEEKPHLDEQFEEITETEEVED